MARVGQPLVGAAPGADWSYDADRYAAVTALRRREQAAMAAFGADGRCLMRTLQEELDDPEPRDCGRCAVCAGAALRRPARPGAGARGGAAPALASRSCWRSRRWRPAPTARCASCPTTCAPRRGGRWRGSATAAGTRSCRRAGAPGASTTSSSTPPPRRCAAGARPSPGWPRSRRSRSGPLVPDFARAARRRARRAVRAGAGARRRRRRRSARWRTPPSRSPTCAAQFAVTRRAAGRPVPAGRRRALQRLDARDARRAAAPPRRARGLPAGAEHGVLTRPR